MTAREKFNLYEAEHEAAIAEHKAAEEALFRFDETADRSAPGYEEERARLDKAVFAAVAKADEIWEKWNEAKKELAADRPATKLFAALRK